MLYGKDDRYVIIWYGLGGYGRYLIINHSIKKHLKIIEKAATTNQYALVPNFFFIR